MIRIVHTNDLHGKLTSELADHIHSLSGFGVDSGDCIKAGNLGVPLSEEPAWANLERAGTQVGTIGNRETHLLAHAFQAKLKGHRHPLVCANLFHSSDNSRPLESHWSTLIEGMKVTFLGLSVAMVTRERTIAKASAYYWTSPLVAAQELVPQLRPECDLLIALTHIGFQNDQKLAAACPELDVIFGGHSHTVLNAPVVVGKTAICQGGSHARFAGVYEIEPGKVRGGLVPLSHR